MDKTLKIMLIAGEVSGDRQVALLARELRAQRPDVHMFGAGGDEMRSAGVDVRVQTSQLGVVGVSEAFRFLKPLRKAYGVLCRLIEAERPQAVILVDNEGFNTTLGKFVKKQGIPVIFYFAPQVWLWGAWRTRGIARLASLILAVFPDEVEVYSRKGGNVRWMGHPLLDMVRSEGNYEVACGEVGLDPQQPTLALMPGSRYHELRKLAPIILGAARKLSETDPDLQFVLPLSAECWRETVDDALRMADMQDRVTLITDHVYTILGRCQAGIIKAGTGTLEMALLGVPMVVVYQMSGLSYNLGKWLLRTPFIAMPNILLERKFVPEYRQRQVTVDRLYEEIQNLLNGGEEVELIREGYKDLRNKLGEEGAIRRAAQVILETISTNCGGKPGDGE